MANLLIMRTITIFGKSCVFALKSAGEGVQNPSGVQLRNRNSKGLGIRAKNENI